MMTVGCWNWQSCDVRLIITAVLAWIQLRERETAQQGRVIWMYRCIQEACLHLCFCLQTFVFACVWCIYVHICGAYMCVLGRGGQDDKNIISQLFSGKITIHNFTTILFHVCLKTILQY